MRCIFTVLQVSVIARTDATMSTSNVPGTHVHKPPHIMRWDACTSSDDGYGQAVGGGIEESAETFLSNRSTSS